MVLITFNSCENFFNGSELKDQIDKAVEIANSSEISVEVNLRNKNSGKISPNGITKIKKGVPIEIELTVASGFDFEDTFFVYDKSNGQEKIENPDEYVKFVEKSAPKTMGGGIITYFYEATILKNISSILISPDITNLNVTTPPTLHEMEIINRYEFSDLVDYFDVNITVEDESTPLQNVDVYFLDNDGNAITTNGSKSIPYIANIKDVGNGLFHLVFRIDLRNQGPAINDGDSFKIKVEVKNEGKDGSNKNFSSSKTSDKILTKYSYSQTRVTVFNNLRGQLQFPPFSLYPPSASTEYMNTEEGVANHSKTVRLIVLECDEKGWDKTPGGQQMPIKYGFTQDSDQLDNPDLADHIIPFYTTYDFASESADVSRIVGETNEKLYPEIPDEQLWEIIDEELKANDMQKEEYRKWIFHETKGPFPNPIQISDEEEDVLFWIWLDVLDKKSEAEEPLQENVDFEQEYTIMDQKLNNSFHKNFSNGQNSHSIIDIPLPSRIDPYKEFYIKVETDNGINGKKYEVFTFPATPKVISAHIENNELTYKLLSSSNSGIYRYKYDEYKWEELPKKEDSFKLPDEFEADNMDYNFYVYSKNTAEMYSPSDSVLACYFYRDCIDTIKYTVKKKTESLEPFPSNIMPEIRSNGTNSETHTIELPFDKNTFNRFDHIFLQYWIDDIEILEEISQSADGRVSFTIPTNLIYNYGNKNESFTYSIIGSKDGRSYSTEYEIFKGDSRIKDNMKPFVPEDPDANQNTYQIERLAGLRLDTTGSYITLGKIFEDNGDGLKIDSDNNITVNIEFTGTNLTAYKEELKVKFPYNKYLNIPISQLPNGDYKFDITIYDKNGNSDSLDCPEASRFKVNRSSVPQGYELINNGTNVSLKFRDAGKGRYSIDFFDGSQWKNIDEGEINEQNKGIKKISSDQKDLGKSGLVRVFVNEDYDQYSYNNTVSYPKYVHVPNKTVSIRDYQLLKNSLRIYSDQPFFVHILQSDTDYGKNIDDWENSQSFTHILDSIPEPIEPKKKDYEPKLEDYDFDMYSWNDAWMNFYGYIYGYSDGPEYKAYEAAMNIYNDKLYTYLSTSFIGSEINPVYETADHSSSPYVYNFPWDKLTKKYAVAVITWADNKRYLIPIDMTLKD